jgi:hypothetical protein
MKRLLDRQPHRSSTLEPCKRTREREAHATILRFCPDPARFMSGGRNHPPLPNRFASVDPIIFLFAPRIVEAILAKDLEEKRNVPADVQVPSRVTCVLPCCLNMPHAGCISEIPPMSEADLRQHPDSTHSLQNCWEICRTQLHANDVPRAVVKP